MTEWNILDDGRARRRRFSWASAAVWGGTVVLCLSVWGLVFWAVKDLAG